MKVVLDDGDTVFGETFTPWRQLVIPCSARSFEVSNCVFLDWHSPGELRRSLLIEQPRTPPPVGARASINNSTFSWLKIGDPA